MVWPWSVAHLMKEFDLAQVEDVVLVDPGRNDQQRRLNCSWWWVELDQLDQVVLENDLARRRGDVLAELEGLGVGHLDAQLAVARSMSRSRLLRPLTRFWPWLLTVSRNTVRVGQREVRRRQRVDELAGEKLIFFWVVVEALDDDTVSWIWRAVIR